MVQNYADIINTAANVNNTSNELAETFVITKEKVISNNKELEQLYLEIKNPGALYTNKFLLSPEIIANLKYKSVVYEYFAKEYTSLDTSLKIEGKIELDADKTKLLIAVGLGNIARLKEYSKSSIMLILQAHYGELKTNLFRAISDFLNKNSDSEDTKKEIERLKNQVISLENDKNKLQEQYKALKAEYEDYKAKHPDK